jgi:hypothetical protein
MRLWRLLAVVASTTTAAVITFGALSASAGAQVDPTTPSVTNIPVNPTYGTNFLATISTNSDGAQSVSSSTTSVCTVGGDKLTVSFVGVGTCTLTAHTALTTTFNAADGNPQSFAVVQAVPSTPTISDLPGNATVGGQFVADVTTNGDGITSVASNATSVCTVGNDGLTVSFAGAGTCSLTAQVAAGTNYSAAGGSAQTFSVLLPPTAPVITNLPPSPVFGQTFMASVQTNGDGTTFVTSGPPGVCTVGQDGLTVTFGGVGTCTLRAHVAAGATYGAGDGSPQPMSVGRATPSTPVVTNIPAAPIFGGGFAALVDTNGDGTPSVNSNTQGVCTVAGDGLSVSFVGAGVCSLTAHVSPGNDYLGADGSAQLFAVGRVTPSTPVVSNIPASPVYGSQFAAKVSTNGDGAPSVSSSTPSVCTAGGDGLTVSFVGVGTCTLTAHVAVGTNYLPADGSGQSFVIGQATPSTPSVSNLPVAPTVGSHFQATVATTGDGATSVTSSTPASCTVSAVDHLTVSFVGVGTCTLTAHVADGTNYLSADGSGQSVVIGQNLPSAPSVSNLPVAPIFGSHFKAIVATTGDGATSVTSSTPASCTVSAVDHLTVSFVGVGQCTLTAHVGAGIDFLAADGASQGVDVDRALPTTPLITNLPGGAVSGGSFTAGVSTNGDGARSVASLTPGACTVGNDGLTVTYVAAGSCTLTAHVGMGSDYAAAAGGPQTFGIAAQPRGYWLVGTDGGIFSFGAAPFYGSMGGTPLQRPVVGITPTASRHGYWLVASDGGIFSFGDSSFYGSIPGLGLHPAGSGLPNSLNAPIVGMVPSSTGHGYFMVASDGGVFAFGDARFEGSCPGLGGCNGAAVAVMPDRSGNGYWLVTARGAVYVFGDASFYGSPPGGSPVVSAVATPDGHGYWIVESNGAVYSYGDANSMGQPLGYVNAYNPATAIFSTSDGRGYWVAASRGDVFSYGDAPYLGSMAAAGLNGLIIAGFGF